MGEAVAVELVGDGARAVHQKAQPGAALAEAQTAGGDGGPDLRRDWRDWTDGDRGGGASGEAEEAEEAEEAGAAGLTTKREAAIRSRTVSSVIPCGGFCSRSQRCNDLTLTRQSFAASAWLMPSLARAALISVARDTESANP